MLAASAAADAVGWGGSGLFVSRDSFEEMMRQSPLPIELLLSCTWQPGGNLPARIQGGVTCGLRFFGLPELQDRTGDQDLNAVRSRLLNLGSYLLANGAVIDDGDTIAAGGHGVIQVRHASDAAGRTVLCLHQTET